jgi:hypothetical protein
MHRVTLAQRKAETHSDNTLSYIPVQGFWPVEFSKGRLGASR